MYSQAEALKTQKYINETETYIKKSLQRQLKSALAKFRGVVAPPPPLISK